MKNKVKKAIINIIVAVLAPVISEISLNLFFGQKQTQKISVQDSNNVVTGNVNAGGDVIIGGTKTTTNIHPLSKE